MDAILDQLSNRDIALLIWLGITILTLLVYRGPREIVSSLLKLFFLSKITIGLLVVLAYVTLLVWVAQSLGIWQWWMLKDTVWWLFGTALVVFFNINKSTEEAHYFRSVALDGLKFSVVLGFILNLYVFNLIIEILLVPILGMLAMLVVVAGMGREYAGAKKFLDGVTSLIGFGILLYVLLNILVDFHGFATLKTLEDFTLPLALTIAILPISYFLALYAAYESLFVRVGFRLQRDDALYRYAKRQIVRVCRGRLASVNRFSKEYLHKLGGVESRAEIGTLMERFEMHRNRN